MKIWTNDRSNNVHTRWKALAEIYTMHSFAPFWNPKSKNGEKGPGQNNPEKRRKQENERPISGPQQATENFSERGFKKKSRAKIKNDYAEQIWSAVCLVFMGLRSFEKSVSLMLDVRWNCVGSRYAPCLSLIHI